MPATLPPTTTQAYCSSSRDPSMRPQLRLQGLLAASTLLDIHALAYTRPASEVTIFGFRAPLDCSFINCTDIPAYTICPGNKSYCYEGSVCGTWANHPDWCCTDLNANYKGGDATQGNVTCLRYAPTLQTFNFSDSATNGNEGKGVLPTGEYCKLPATNPGYNFLTNMAESNASFPYDNNGFACCPGNFDIVEEWDYAGDTIARALCVAPFGSGGTATAPSNSTGTGSPTATTGTGTASGATSTKASGAGLSSEASWTALLAACVVGLALG
ncbi:hypothetical protein LTR91_018310 [Friedmanniomyces endolithicus]|uniref:Uncharacterized protein n=2 Tax=Friedmanniomyces endolithicus TaxID=329885 RepID=A0AAN6HCR3_9PEZI|nr:hypothetical protein LTR59_016815 [Friedmanniomyces endolithicus]KAK0774467.1 hypothetical protein LTR75_016868 [Friedmanniomyces endolithicus]KAK0806398.1 hypothetical protein LTR38_005244 [Friedmanniomyces endolithicus]KAK0837249.1 hypothetical protein LTR03_012960 [Friedmanniomyces endolithicus]KAK0844883.1 hypothetical protein LTS02_015509 [Friedmanniomyces endolithicus]